MVIHSPSSPKGANSLIVSVLIIIGHSTKVVKGVFLVIILILLKSYYSAMQVDGGYVGVVCAHKTMHICWKICVYSKDFFKHNLIVQII